MDVEAESGIGAVPGVYIADRHPLAAPDELAVRTRCCARSPCRGNRQAMKRRDDGRRDRERSIGRHSGPLGAGDHQGDVAAHGRADTRLKRRSAGLSRVRRTSGASTMRRLGSIDRPTPIISKPSKTSSRWPSIALPSVDGRLKCPDHPEERGTPPRMANKAGYRVDRQGPGVRRSNPDDIPQHLRSISRADRLFYRSPTMHSTPMPVSQHGFTRPGD